MLALHSTELQLEEDGCLEWCVQFWFEVPTRTAHMATGENIHLKLKQVLPFCRNDRILL
jgi:hypothetical protein